MDISI